MLKEVKNNIYTKRVNKWYKQSSILELHIKNHNMATYSEECIEIIKFLETAGRKQDSFLDTFPYIHHFRKKGGDATLKGFYSHCENHEIEGETNLNFYSRLLYIKEKVNIFVSENPDNTGVSSMKYLRFATLAVEKFHSNRDVL